MRELPGIVKKHYKAVKALSKAANCLNPRNRLHPRGLTLHWGLNLLNGLKIKNYGVDNQVILEDFARLKNCTILLHGNHNRVHIKAYTHLTDATFYTEKDGNTITVGTHTYICGATELAALEGTQITIGDECLFSGDIHLRTGDSHSLLNAEGRRINRSQDIVISDHVWIGTRVTCLKGTFVAENSVAAATATLSGKYTEPGSVLGGVPAKVIKSGISWSMERLPIEE